MAPTIDDTPNGIEISVEATVNFKAPFRMTGQSTPMYALFNFEFGICLVGYFVSTAPNSSFNSYTKWPIRDSDNGLQYFTNNMWKSFDNTVQEAYATFRAEQALLK